MIYYDKTEGRVQTRLSQSILEMGEAVVGLEPATGADLLITPMGSLAGNVYRPPGKVQLPMHLDNAFLVQRKSGSDLLNSIPDLHNIIWKMRLAGDEHNCRYWLLVCGEFEMTHDKMVVCEGRTTGWSWASLQGALEMWSLFGGHISINPSDEACGITLERWNRNIEAWVQDVEKLGLEKQEIPKLFLDPRPWRATLMTFPNCGDIMSNNIAEENKRLCDALVWMSQPEAFGIRGVGQKTIDGFRKYFGLKDGESLSVIRDQPEFHEESGK